MTEEIRDVSWMDDLEGGTFISFSGGPVNVEFQESNPIKKPNSWGKDVWNWDVLLLDEDLIEIGPRILSTASKRLKRALARHAPLARKRLRLNRTGDKMDTEYSASEISKKDLV